ncbi:helix-hairpin-helix domain-containing protein [Silvimonas soli]|uniref:helix-hairpin-helix domain-containing protein n=1 Tax=Silvimonas soli TaxID=2980100 RepID=UPI0024B3B448|nr:helix-hairpin-helix domain-containing protein [Silvimonas soli]
MNPQKVDRDRVVALTDLPNIGPASAKDLRLLGIEQPAQLAGRCPYAMYAALCDQTGVQHDPCVIDVFISVTRFMAGEAAQPWWAYTEERKRTLQQRPNQPTLNDLSAINL